MVSQHLKLSGLALLACCGGSDGASEGAAPSSFQVADQLFAQTMTTLDSAITAIDELPESADSATIASSVVRHATRLVRLRDESGRARLREPAYWALIMARHGATFVEVSHRLHSAMWRFGSLAQRRAVSSALDAWVYDLERLVQYAPYLFTADRTSSDLDVVVRKSATVYHNRRLTIMDIGLAVDFDETGHVEALNQVEVWADWRSSLADLLAPGGVLSRDPGAQEAYEQLQAEIEARQ